MAFIFFNLIYKIFRKIKAYLTILMIDYNIDKIFKSTNMDDRDIVLIKNQLENKLAEITIKKSKKFSLLTDVEGDHIEISSDYDHKKFGFSKGQFIKKNVHSIGSKIGICVGVGKGCSHEPERIEIWFLWQNDEGISHYCGKRAEDFKRYNFVLLE